MVPEQQRRPDTLAVGSDLVVNRLGYGAMRRWFSILRYQRPVSTAPSRLLLVPPRIQETPVSAVTPTDMPHAVATYLHAKTDEDVDMTLACFADEAVVHDEGTDHVGVAAIRDWASAVSAQYGGLQG
ncbi:MAG: nuclear transport factor 2 family protein [Pseudonocardiaceae bacterium]